MLLGNVFCGIVSLSLGSKIVTSSTPLIIMKISNAHASKFYKLQIVDFVYIAIFNAIFLFCIYYMYLMQNTFGICIFIFLIVLINFLVLKFFTNTDYYERYCDDIVKYLILDRNNLQIVFKNKEQKIYSVNMLERISLDIETELYQVSRNTRVRPKRILIKFLIQNSEAYGVEVRELYDTSYMKLIHKIIDNTPPQAIFECNFSGLSDEAKSGYQEVITINKIEKYITKHKKYLRFLLKSDSQLHSNPNINLIL